MIRLRISIIQVKFILVEVKFSKFNNKPTQCFVEIIVPNSDELVGLAGPRGQLHRQQYAKGP